MLDFASPKALSVLFIKRYYYFRQVLRILIMQQTWFAISRLKDDKKEKRLECILPILLGCLLTNQVRWEELLNHAVELEFQGHGNV